MGLTSQIDAAERRLNKILPVVSPPELGMKIFFEKDYEQKKIPISESRWDLNLVIEKKRPFNR